MNKRIWVLAAVLLATFLSAMEATIVSTAMPSIVNDLQGMQYVNLTFSVYLLVAAVTTPIYGKLADILGRKKVLVAAIVLFLIGSALCGMAVTMTQLILFRAVQALGAGAILPVTSTIIGDIYTTEERTRMQALFSGVWSVSGVIGPLLGGFLVEAINWRWIFYINLPLGFIALALLAVAFREPARERERKPIDFAGAGLFLVAVTSILYVLLFGETEALRSPLHLGLLALSAVSLIAFVIVEQNAKDPFFPLTLMKNRFVLVPNLFGFFGFSFMIATTVYIPMWVQNIQGGSPTLSGFALAFMTFGWPLGAALNGTLLKRYGPWNVAVFGAGALVAAAGLLATVGPGSPVAIFFAVMFLAGFAFGLTVTVFTIILQNAVEWERRGVAMGSNALSNMLGQTISIAALGTVFNAATRHETSPEQLAHGIHVVFLCVLGLTVVAFLISTRLPKLTKEELFRDSRTSAEER